MAKNIFDILTRVSFVGNDFETYAQEVEDFLKTNFPDDFKDYVNNNLGVALLQLIAYSSQNLAFYINQRTTNLLLTESTDANIISRIARQLNYDIQPAISSRTEVTIRLSNGPYAFPVILNKGFKFNAEKGLIYEYRKETPVIWAPGEIEKTIELREGETLQNVFISSGIENQVFKLAGIDEDFFVADQSFQVTVGTEVWTEKRRITFDEEPIYEVNYLVSPPEIRFGDGVAGLVPPANDQITVEFVRTKGLQGNIAQNGILSASDTLISNNTTIGIEVVNSTESGGGDDPEDLRRVKRQAPEFFQSQDRAITKRDYDAIVNTFAGIAIGDAQIIRSIDQDLTLNNFLDNINDSVSGCSGTIQTEVSEIVSDMRNYLGSIISDTCKSNTVQVSILSKNINNLYVAPTSDLREELRLHLEDRNDAVHVVKVVSGESNIIEPTIDIEISVSPNAVESEVLERARLALEKSDTQPFGILILRNYGESLYLDHIYRAIRDNQSVAGEIEYMNIKITSPLDKLDEDGNLIISAKQQEIIQPGTLNISVIPKTIVIGS